METSRKLQKPSWSFYWFPVYYKTTFCLREHCENSLCYCIWWTISTIRKIFCAFPIVFFFKLASSPLFGVEAIIRFIFKLKWYILWYNKTQQNNPECGVGWPPTHSPHRTWLRWWPTPRGGGQTGSVASGRRPTLQTTGSKVCHRPSQGASQVDTDENDGESKLETSQPMRVL